MRILVTGASGFLGRSLMPILGASVGAQYSRVLSWDRITFGDFLSPQDRARALEVALPDTVIHLAWLQTSSADYEDDPRNTDWAEATIEFAREVRASGARFFGTGSMIEEDLKVRTPYADAKRMVAASILQDSSEPSLTAWWRPAWVFDFAEPRPRVLSAYARAVESRKSFYPTNPLTTRDFIHARDVASAMKCLVDHSVVGSWNISTGRETSVAELLACFDRWRQRGRPPLGTSPIAKRSQDSSSPGGTYLTGIGWEPQETAWYLAGSWTTSPSGPLSNEETS